MTKDRFAQEYEAGRLRTVNFLISKGLTKHVAEEIAQAAWVRGWECRGQLRDLHKTLAWINSIALNMGRNDRRYTARMTGETDVAADPPLQLLAVLDVQRKLALCRPRDRNLLKKHYWEECSIAELAEREHCSMGAMRLRLLRARRSLRRLFEAKGTKRVKRKMAA
jgi:DNA-directed RNA polymerase specialized sigma24 family protein